MKLFKDKDNILATLFVLATFIWIGINQEWYLWYNQEGNAEFFKWLYTLLDNCWLANIPISIIIISFSSCIFHKIWHDKDYRSYRLPMTISGLIILNYKCQVVYANIIHNFDYRMLFSILLGAMAMTTLFKGIKKIISYIYANRRKDKDATPTGFSTDNSQNSRIPSSLISYASIIANRLLAIKDRKESYAIGITGEWGVGKTTFLDILKSQLKDNAEIVNFNPWMCRTPEQVTHDFFASLRHQLSPKYSSLSSPIKKYAKYINGLAQVPNNALGIDFSFITKDDSLFDKKRNLSKKFYRLPHPVVVVIDDIDRLERDEVFEVLRLIRNTADLSNTIYLVAYDKEYVTSILEEKNIKNSSSYLEKIFQVEVHLPKVNDYLIWEALKTDIKEQDNINNNFTEELFMYLRNSERALILRVLDNFRRAKRFSRIFMLNIKYLSSQYQGEIKILDLFWLELLQTYDKQTYDKLANDPNYLLYSENDRLRLRPGITHSTTEKGKNIYTGTRFWKEETPNILEMIFGTHIRTKKASICYIENYEKYFALSVSPYKLSIKEAQELFNPESDPKNIITRWVDSGKYLNSIIYQFKQMAISNLEDDKLRIFLESILYFGLKTTSYHNSHIGECKKFLSKEMPRSEFAHNVAISWIENRIQEGENLFLLSKFLKSLYQTEEYDYEAYKYFHKLLIISNNEIEENLIKTTRLYLANHPEFTALDILNEEHILFRFFGNCCVLTTDNIAYDNSCEYKQVAFDAVIEHFADKETKPSFEEYRKAYSKLFNQEIPSFSSAEEENDWWAYVNEFIEHNMEEHYGSSYANKLEEFRKRCFVKTV